MEVVVSKQHDWFSKVELKISHSEGKSTDVLDRTTLLDFETADLFGIFHNIPQWDRNGSLAPYTLHVSLDDPGYFFQPLRRLPIHLIGEMFVEPRDNCDTLVLFDDGYAYTSLSELAECKTYSRPLAKNFDKTMKLLTEADKNEKGYYQLKCEKSVTDFNMWLLAHLQNWTYVNVADIKFNLTEALAELP